MTDRTSGSQTWAGTTLSTPNGLLSSIPFVSGATTISAHVYSPASGITVRLKAEDHTDPTKSVETEATTTVANGWSTVVFDFANEAPGTAMIDFSYNYDMLSIFFDFGNTPSSSSIYYLDSVSFGGLVGGIAGCTDPAALNYDPLATIDDGSCLYTVTFNVDMNCDTNSFGYVHLESPVFGWCGGCVPMTDPDGDGIHSVSVDLTSGDFEYKYAVDGFAGQEDLLDDMLAGGSCAPITDYFSYANRLVTVVSGITTSDVYGSCNACILGCTDPLANNYDSLATFDDGSCVLCSYGCLDSLAFNYDSLATCDDGSCIPYIYGCTDPLAINYYPGANSDDGSCIYSGCTDPLANNYNPNATIDDGSCTYLSCTNSSPSGLFLSWTTDTKAEVNWDNMNDTSGCMVLKYFVRYREVGTLSWNTKSAGVGNGLCNFGLNTTNKILQNLTSGTTYEFKMKAFYCGGNESNYSAPVQFSTSGDCAEMINLSVQTFNGNQSKATFLWDTVGTYVFARIALRVDTAGANWQTAGGFGVYYPTLSVNKFGLQSGESYRAQGRTFCDSNITSYRSWWTSPVFWTQPGLIRMSGGEMVNNLNVYPNPTNDIFNVSFVSKDIQTLSIRVLNIVGEVIHTESLEQFIGEYTKKITIGDNSKGIYFLEISNNNITTNKKIIVQ